MKMSKAARRAKRIYAALWNEHENGRRYDSGFLRRSSIEHDRRRYVKDAKEAPRLRYPVAPKLRDMEARKNSPLWNWNERDSWSEFKQQIAENLAPAL